MATIKDVAKHTGLSIATISKYLNGGNVLEENRVRIDEAIHGLKYRVNRNARSLKTNRTMTIGVITPTISIPFFGSVVSAMDITLRAAGYTCFICSYDFDRTLEMEKLRILINHNVDGIVMIPQAVTAKDLEEICSTQHRQIPMILIDRIVADYDCDNIVIDNLNATYSAVEQFVAAQHKRIGIIVGPLSISTAYERLTGFRRVHEDYGIPIDEQLVKIGNYDFESGYRLFNNFMEMPNPPTALCITNYDMTVGAVTAARERGVALGVDVGFVGFDAVELCRVISPPLPVIEQPTQEMGTRAGELMLKRLSGDHQSFPHLLRLKSKLHLFEKDGSVNLFE